MVLLALALAVEYPPPLGTMLHTQMEEVNLGIVMAVVDIEMAVEAEASRPTMDRL